MGEGNGNGEREAEQLPHITITVSDPLNFVLAITGNVPTDEYAINMLTQALREYEMRWRIARMARHQAELIDAANMARIRAELGQKR